MTARDLKLAIVCGTENDEVIALNAFFKNLFNVITIYHEDDNTNLIFMDGDKFIMKYFMKSKVIDCRYEDFWKVLEVVYNCSYAEAQEIIAYKVNEAFKSGTLIPHLFYNSHEKLMENAFKNGDLKPICIDAFL